MLIGFLADNLLLFAGLEMTDSKYRIIDARIQKVIIKYPNAFDYMNFSIIC